MKIKLNRALKIVLLEAIKNGVLDLAKVPELLKEIQGMNVFLELMKKIDSEDD